MNCTDSNLQRLRAVCAATARLLYCNVCASVFIVAKVKKIHSKTDLGLYEESRANWVFL